MNNLQNKADELINKAAEFGINAQITMSNPYQIVVQYAPRFYSVIGFSETNRVRVLNYEQVGRRTDKVSTKNLPDWFAFYAENKIA